MRRYAEATLRFGVVTSFTLFFGGLSVTAVGEPGADVKQSGQDGEPGVVINLASLHALPVGPGLAADWTWVAPGARLAGEVITAAVERRISDLIALADRWNAGAETAVASVSEPVAVVKLAALAAPVVSDGRAAGENINVFTEAEPIERDTLARLLSNPMVGVTSFVQRWSAQEDSTQDAEPRVVITLASLPPVEQNTSAWEPEIAASESAEGSKIDAASADVDGTVTAADTGTADPSPVVEAVACLRSSIIGQLARLEGSALMARSESIIGVASFYDDPQRTSSGEEYDPNAFTAAAQLAIRDKFGGIRFGKNYQAAYAVAEYEGKRIIVKFNDVGPLRPGRLFDLSRAAMAYFGGLDKGLLQDVRVTPLPLGYSYTPGPVSDEQAAVLFEDLRRQKQVTQVSLLQ